MVKFLVFAWVALAECDHSMVLDWVHRFNTWDFWYRGSEKLNAENSRLAALKMSQRTCIHR